MWFHYRSHLSILTSFIWRVTSISKQYIKVIQVCGTPSTAAGGCSTTWKPFKDITKYDELHGSLRSKCFTPPHFIHNKQVLVMSGCGVCLCVLVSHTLDGFSGIRKYVCVVTSETGAFRFWNLFTLSHSNVTQCELITPNQFSSGNHCVTYFSVWSCPGTVPGSVRQTFKRWQRTLRKLKKEN